MAVIIVNPDEAIIGPSDTIGLTLTPAPGTTISNVEWIQSNPIGTITPDATPNTARFKPTKEGTTVGNCLLVRYDGFIMCGSERKRAAIFKCPCGNEFRNIVVRVKRGDVKTCGCRHNWVERHGTPERYKDGKIRPEYHTWQGMQERCRNPNNKRYKNYGGKGISVCQRWQDSFLNFLKDVGEKPTPKHSLDRFPNKNGNYEPGNVRWATPKEQARNVSTNVLLTYGGKTMCVSEWAEVLSIPSRRIQQRLADGKDVGFALSRYMFSCKKGVEPNPVKLTLSFT